MRRLAAAILAAALIALPGVRATAEAQTAIALDRGFIVGRWTDTGNCADAVRMLGDGRFVAQDGSEGLWHLEGSRLTLTGQSTILLGVVPVDRDTINIVNPNGSLGRSTRCPGDRGGLPPAVVVDNAYLIGRWTDNGDCAAAVEFRRDFRFRTVNGAEGAWRLQGDRLTMTGASSLTLQIVPFGRNVTNVVNEDGSLGRSTRC